MSRYNEIMREMPSVPSQAYVDELVAQLKDHKDEEVANIAQNISTAVQRLLARLKRTQEMLQEQYLDADYELDEFVDYTTSQLSSKGEIVRGSRIYDNTWFKKLPFSPIGKKRLAKEMLARAERYNMKPLVWVNWSEGLNE